MSHPLRPGLGPGLIRAAFETIEIRSGVPFDLDLHLDRLTGSCARLGMVAPESSRVRHAAEATLNSWDGGSARMRITWTSQEQLLVSVAGMPERNASAAVTISATPINERSVLSGSKTSAAGPFAVISTEHPGYDEVLLPNLRGELCDGLTSNFFAVIDGRLMTPPISSGCLAGVTRQLVIDCLAGAGIAVVEEPIIVDQMMLAEEVFLTSSTRRVQAVRSITALGKTVHLPHPGPLTSTAMGLFEDLDP